MSVTQTARFPDDLHAALKEHCDRTGNSANAEIILAVRKHLGMPTVEDRLDSLEEGLRKCIDRLNRLEASAIATQQSSDTDIRSSADD